MNSNRIYDIVINSITGDILRAQEDLEITINSAVNSDEKTNKIKELVGKIVLSEQMLIKFSGYVSNDSTSEDKQ